MYQLIQTLAFSRHTRLPPLRVSLIIPQHFTIITDFSRWILQRFLNKVIDTVSIKGHTACFSQMIGLQLLYWGSIIIAFTQYNITQGHWPHTTTIIFSSQSFEITIHFTAIGFTWGSQGLASLSWDTQGRELIVTQAESLLHNTRRLFHIQPPIHLSRQPALLASYKGGMGPPRFQRAA